MKHTASEREMRQKEIKALWLWDDEGRKKPKGKEESHNSKSKQAYPTTKIKNPLKMTVKSWLKTQHSEN